MATELHTLVSTVAYAWPHGCTTDYQAVGQGTGAANEIAYFTVGEQYRVVSLVKIAWPEQQTQLHISQAGLFWHTHICSVGAAIQSSCTHIDVQLAGLFGTHICSVGVAIQSSCTHIDVQLAERLVRRNIPMQNLVLKSTSRGFQR